MLGHRPTEPEPVHLVVSVSQPNRLPQIFVITLLAIITPLFSFRDSFRLLSDPLQKEQIL